jgi:hypothetical protein
MLEEMQEFAQLMQEAEEDSRSNHSESSEEDTSIDSDFINIHPVASRSVVPQIRR